jgi:SAM-dependent MidA family methyltransferase
MSLRTKIEREIREGGPMPFSRYMEICLYDRAEGYYSRNSSQFGKAGDFYTSSDVHAVFGRLLARQFEEMWRVLGRPGQIEILELGPGRGLFARDVLDWSRKKFPDFFASLTYALQESSPALQAKLKETVEDYLGSGKALLPTPAEDASMGTCRPATPTEVRRSLPFQTPLIVFTNEFLDALPVEILSAEGKLHIGLEKGRLTEIWLSSAAEELEFLDRYSVHPKPGERIEVPRVAQAWGTAVAKAIHRGFAVMIDYGYTRAEQLAGRHHGTLMAYRQHSAGPNPYEAPGEQDLTAHVNFTALLAAFEQAGMIPQYLVTQAQFLMGIGEQTQFADAFEECRVPQERAKVALQLKHLISPEGMGETFRLFLASRGVEPATVEALSGLQFGRSAESR